MAEMSAAQVVKGPFVKTIYPLEGQGVGRML